MSKKSRTGEPPPPRSLAIADGTTIPAFASHDDIARQVIVGLRGADFSAAGLKALVDEFSDAFKNFAPHNVTYFVSPEKSGGNPRAIFVYQAMKGSAAALANAVRAWPRKPSYSPVDVNVELRIAQAVAAWDDPLFARRQWGLRRIGALEDWNSPVPTQVTVAIVDSGVMWHWPATNLAGDSVQFVHEDLDGRPPGAQFPPRFWRSGEQPPLNDLDDDRNGAADDLNGARFIGNLADGRIGDDDGHGTMLAGIAFAIPGNGLGLAAPLSDYWNIKLMPIKFFGPRTPPSAASACQSIEYAVANGAKVINASWHVGPGGRGLIALEDAIKVAKRAGVLVVAAAGNDGADNDRTPTYPANFGCTHDNVVAVLATDRRDHKTWFSNYGRGSVHIGAPGLRIATTARYRSGVPAYREFSGTSPAAAFVSLAAAMVFARNPNATPAEVIGHLMNTGDAVRQLANCTISGKRLNLAKAVKNVI